MRLILFDWLDLDGRVIKTGNSVLFCPLLTVALANTWWLGGECDSFAVCVGNGFFGGNKKRRRVLCIVSCAMGALEALS